MPTPQARVIEAAVRPFSDNAELKLAATELLAGMSDNPSEEAIARWEAVDANKRGPVRRWLPWGLLAVVSALMWLADSKEMIAYFDWVKWAMHPLSAIPPEAEQRTAAHLDARGKLLVFGHLRSEDKVARKERLWQSEPENPAYFAEYAVAFASENHSLHALPPYFLQTARRLAPDNAWFTYLAASVEARDAVQSTKGKPPWKTLDQGKLDRALALLRDARTQTKCTSYTAELLRQRLPLLPQGNLMERFDSNGSLASGFLSPQIQFLHVSQALVAAAWGAGERGDVPAFQEIARDGDHFLRGIYQDEVGTVIGEAVSARYAGTLAQSFAETASKLGLREEADAWKKIADDSEKRQKTSRTRKFEVDGKVVAPRTVTGSMLGESVEQLGKFLETPLPLTDADVKPGRLLDHEILSRFFNYICWLVMVPCLGVVAAYRFRVSELSRRLAARMGELLGPADWAWIVGLGILLPFAFVMGINRFTPLGGRAFGMKGTAMLMPAGHFLGLLVLWLVLPVQIIRWRLARRAGGFGFSRPSLLGWVAAVCAVAFVPWIGWIAITGWFPYGWVGWMNDLGIEVDVATQLPLLSWPLVLLGIPVLWLCGVAARALFGRADRQFHRTTAARVLVGSWAAALGVLCLSSQAFKATEHYWFVREGLGRMDPAQPGWSVYEYRVAAQLRKELRDILHLHGLQ